MRTFDTYSTSVHEVTKDSKIYTFYSSNSSGEFEFKGLVTEQTKIEIENGGLIGKMNNDFEQSKLLLNMSGHKGPNINKMLVINFLFVPLTDATMVQYSPEFKD